MQDQNPALENYDDKAYPTGWRFFPTDAEAIYCYLKNKVENRPLSAVNIKEVDVYKFNPQDLADRYKPNCDRPKEWYFFTPRDRKYRNGKRPNRKAGDGFWKATGADKEVKMKGKVIGWKRALVFYYGKSLEGEKTSWIMHEYMLKDASPSLTIDTSSDDMKLDVCVLCKIYKNTRKSDIEQEQYTSDQNHSLYSSQNQNSSSYQYLQLGSQATRVNSFQKQPSPSIQYKQFGYQGMSESNFQSQPSSSHQSLQPGAQENIFQNRPSLSYQYMQLGAPATSENNFQSQPSSSHQSLQPGAQENIFQNRPSLSYQCMQLGAQATSENNFQSQPSSSHQSLQFGAQENIFQNQPSSSYQYMQLGAQENIFQNQPSSSYQYSQLGAQAMRENNFQSQPSSSHHFLQFGAEENIFQNQPSSSYQYMQLGAQATGENNFQNQPLSPNQCLQLEDQINSEISWIRFLRLINTILEDNKNHI